MVLQDLFSNEEIDIIIDALQKRHTFWRAVGNRPIQGYGTATEAAKKEQALEKAERISELMTKVTNITI